MAVTTMSLSITKKPLITYRSTGYGKSAFRQKLEKEVNRLKGVFASNEETPKTRTLASPTRTSKRRRLRVNAKHRNCSAPPPRDPTPQLPTEEESDTHFSSQDEADKGITGSITQEQLVRSQLDANDQSKAARDGGVPTADVSGFSDVKQDTVGLTTVSDFLDATFPSPSPKCAAKKASSATPSKNVDLNKEAEKSPFGLNSRKRLLFTVLSSDDEREPSTASKGTSSCGDSSVLDSKGAEATQARQARSELGEDATYRAQTSCSSRPRRRLRRVAPASEPESSQDPIAVSGRHVTEPKPSRSKLQTNILETVTLCEPAGPPRKKLQFSASTLLRSLDHEIKAVSSNVKFPDRVKMMKKRTELPKPKRKPMQTDQSSRAHTPVKKVSAHIKDVHLDECETGTLRRSTRKTTRNFTESRSHIRSPAQSLQHPTTPISTRTLRPRPGTKFLNTRENSPHRSLPTPPDAGSTNSGPPYSTLKTPTRALGDIANQHKQTWDRAISTQEQKQKLKRKKVEENDWDDVPPLPTPFTRMDSISDDEGPRAKRSLSAAVPSPWPALHWR
ncbi:hypothetical protein DFJ77DRAFT_287173 [Powellomyces hirtus]|nr:hypothetical protein DFJ77DRAFT_287173 [Powellomyces hirtus]